MFDQSVVVNLKLFHKWVWLHRKISVFSSCIISLPTAIYVVSSHQGRSLLVWLTVRLGLPLVLSLKCLALNHNMTLFLADITSWKSELSLITGWSTRNWVVSITGLFISMLEKILNNEYSSDCITAWCRVLVFCFSKYVLISLGRKFLNFSSSKSSLD